MNKWRQLGPTVITEGQAHSNVVRVNVTGRITAIVIHPKDSNIIYLGTAQGGIWKTTDGGSHWAPTSDNVLSLAIGALAIDPSNPEVLYAGTGEGNFTGDSQYGLGILKTTDGGKTWVSKGWESNVKNTFTNSRFCQITVNPNNSRHIFAATRAGNNPAGIYSSTDAGESWSMLTNGLPPDSVAATDIVLDPSNPDTAYAAFYGNGIYKTLDANTATPTWTQQTNDLPSSNLSRIALGISPSSTQTLYALMSNDKGEIDKFYRTVDGGSSWTSIELPDSTVWGKFYPKSIGSQGTYNLNVAVDPKNPDIVYLSGILIWKAVRSSNDQWTFTDVGSNIHTDNHAFAFGSGYVYAGNDGGIYRSADGGNNWDDSINKGLCITQFEFMEQHPTNEKIIIAGTQDNGTDIYKGQSEFYHAAGGDGGFVCLDPNKDPNKPDNVWHTYYDLSPQFSSQGGERGTWQDLSGSLKDNNMKSYPSNFYPPMTLDKTNPNNIAIGGQILYIDGSKGNGGWSERINLNPSNDPTIYDPTIPADDNISAINFVNSNLIYVGTNGGRVYRISRSWDTNQNKWTYNLNRIHSGLGHLIWDIGTLPSDDNTIIVVVSGFYPTNSVSTPHVFRGKFLPGNNTATWTDISGTGSGRLPDIPVNALAIDENNESTMYIGTDVGVFCTVDGGTNWMSFSRGLPVCQVYDLRLNSSKGLLTAATHGRGMWQWSDKTDPTVILNPDGRLEVFWVRHPDEHIYHKWQTTKNGSSSWSDGWAQLDPVLGVKFSFGTNPAIMMIEGKLHVLWTYSDHLSYAYQYGPRITGIYQDPMSGKEHITTSGIEWISRQSSITDIRTATVLGDPVVGRNADGNPGVFFVVSRVMKPFKSSSTFNQLYYGPGPEISLTSSRSLEGYWSPNARPTVAQNKDGRLDLFMVGMDDKLYHSWQTTKNDNGQWAWSSWVELAGPLANEPAVASNDDGRLELFKVDAVDGKLYHRWQLRASDSSQWSNGWDPLEAPFLPRQTPTVARNGDGRLELFMVGMDHKLYHKWQTTKDDSTNWHEKWEILADTLWPLNSNPIVARNEDGRLELFMVGNDNTVHHRWQTTKNDSTQWSSWDSF
jgi:photosystem II stability/assembly factor-like uncharacterized protein